MDFDHDAVLQAFLVESDEILALVEETLLALERQLDDAEDLATLFRSFHTIKGNALSLGFSGAGELAHAVEDLLARLRAGELAVSSGLVTLLLRAVDALRQMIAAGASGADQVLPEHLSLLDQVRQGVLTGGFAATPAPRARGRARGPGATDRRDRHRPQPNGSGPGRHGRRAPAGGLPGDGRPVPEPPRAGDEAPHGAGGAALPPVRPRGPRPGRGPREA